MRARVQRNTTKAGEMWWGSVEGSFWTITDMAKPMKDGNTTGLHEETAGDIERTVKDVVSKIDERFTKYKSDGV